MNCTAAPIYFESGSETLFGWLHRPPSQVRQDVGVVICNPFGYEAICAHGSLRAFADACAALGLGALRFDYSATGDSSGDQTDLDQVALWTADIRVAADVLRKECGVRRVCLLGMRLGALLASLVAADGAVDGLIALAPIVSGRRYLRELRTFQGSAASEVPGPSQNGDLEVAGFRLSAASVATLTGIDLSGMAQRGASSVLVLDRSDLPGANSWAQAMLGLGSAVRYLALPGFADMVSTPHAAQVSQPMLGATVEWLERFRQCSSRKEAALEPADPVVELPPLATPPALMRLTSAGGPPIEERALYLDDRCTLFSIISTRGADFAAGDVKPGYGVVLLNVGATHHIGPNRMYVDIARRWAALGYTVLRLDLAGLGDSATHPGERANEVYPPHAIDDIAVAIDFLQRRYEVKNITLVGLCAGAYHALRAATAGLPVETVLLVNPLTFYWKQGSTMNDLQIAEVVRNPGLYRSRVLVGNAWMKVFRGRVNLWRVAMIFVRRFWLTILGGLQNLARALHIPLSDDLGSELQLVVSRGVRIVFMFARGDTGRDLLKIQGGSALESLGDGCRIYTIDGADHIFSQSAPRRQLLQLLGSELPK